MVSAVHPRASYKDQEPRKTKDQDVRRDKLTCVVCTGDEGILSHVCKVACPASLDVKLCNNSSSFLKETEA